jgi:hypothetical protein
VQRPILKKHLVYDYRWFFSQDRALARLFDLMTKTKNIGKKGISHHNELIKTFFVIFCMFFYSQKYTYTVWDYYGAL